MTFDELRTLLDEAVATASSLEKPHVEALLKIRKAREAAETAILERFMLDQLGVYIHDSIQFRYRRKLISGEITSVSSFFDEKYGRKVVVSVYTEEFGFLYILFPDINDGEYDTIPHSALKANA